MEAAAEGAVGLSEARDGSPLSDAAASDDGDTVIGDSYGMDAADTGRSTLFYRTPAGCRGVHVVHPEIHVISPPLLPPESPESSLLARGW